MNLLLSDPAFLSVASAVGGGGASDPYFSNVSLLLHGDGANGSTTIIDSSPSPKTVTAFGNAQISTAIADPFGDSSKGVIALDGTGDYLSIPTVSFAQAEDFTLEAWIYKTQKDLSGYANVFSEGSNTQIGYDISTEGSIFLFIAGGFGVAAAGTAVPTNSWCHLAWARSGSSCYAFVNGILQGSGTRDSAFSFDSIGALGGAGYEVNGYIDDIRVTKGICRYTSNFTPPTAPFPDA